MKSKAVMEVFETMKRLGKFIGKRPGKFVAVRLLLALFAAFLVMGIEPATDQHEAERDMHHAIRSMEADGDMVMTLLHLPKA